MTRALGLGLALILAPVLPLCAQDIGKAEGVYKQFCAHCHGIGMVNPGTSSFDLRKFPVDERDRFYSSVTDGKGDMPAWGDILLPDELELLWLYVATRGGKEPAPEQTGEVAPPPSRTVRPGVLTACLPVNGGTLSSRRQGGGVGLDFALHEALSGAAGLGAEVVWFESEPDEESDPVRETYAMLSLPLCDVVYSHPLFPSSFGPPPAQRAAPPRWDDRPTTWREGTQVPLGPVAVSTPYRRAELGIVLGPAAADTTVGSLDDLENLRIGIAQGTLGGVLLETQLPARLRAGAQLFAPGPGFLWQMEAGAFDATLVDTTAYDFHRRQNPITSLTLGEYRHPLGFNMGIAYLAGNAGLGAFLNGELAALLRVGTVAAMAEVSGTTYAPPVKPDVAQPLSLATLLSTR